MSIELWAARLERPLTERETAAMLRLLPEARRERLLRIKQPEKRREPLCAYLILRHALWEQYRWRELPEIRLSSFGKPYFPEHPDVHFNLSHTAGAVLVGLSDRPVGVARTKRSGTGVGTMLDAETPLQPGEQFYFLDTFPGYVAGVSTKGGGPPGPVRKYALDEMMER